MLLFEFKQSESYGVSHKRFRLDGSDHIAGTTIYTKATKLLRTIARALPIAPIEGPKSAIRNAMIAP
jgi:hypothetical protein